MAGIYVNSMDHIHQGDGEPLVSDGWVLVRNRSDCDGRYLIGMRLIDGWCSDAHVQRYNIASTQEYWC